MNRTQTDSLYPPLTSELVRRGGVRIVNRQPLFPWARVSEDAKFFSISWAGGFVFFITFLG